MPVKPVNKANRAQLTPSQFRQYRVVCAALWCKYHNSEINYSNKRGKSLKDEFRPPPYVPGSFDCSGFATYCYRVAGCPDPNGAGYGGNMDTGSLWNNGTLVGGANTPMQKMEPGDLVFYAYDGPLKGGNSEHVSVYIDDGYIVSMGNDNGPSMYPFDKETKPLYGVRRYAF